LNYFFDLQKEGKEQLDPAVVHVDLFTTTSAQILSLFPLDKIGDVEKILSEEGTINWMLIEYFI
jgi:hypothetical protein